MPNAPKLRQRRQLERAGLGDARARSGSFCIYADVATGPDGKVYVVWWDLSAANAIRGDVCNPATQNCASAAGWGTPQTIATLDATDGVPIPFECAR